MLITGGHLDPAARQAPPARPAELGRSRVRRSRSACGAGRHSSWPTRSAGPDCFLAVYGVTLWASAAFAVASPDDTATAVAGSSIEAAVSGDPWAGLFEDLLAAYRSLAADVVTVTRDQLPVYRELVDTVQLHPASAPAARQHGSGK